MNIIVFGMEHVLKLKIKLLIVKMGVLGEDVQKMVLE